MVYPIRDGKVRYDPIRDDTIRYDEVRDDEVWDDKVRVDLIRYETKKAQRHDVCL